VTGTGLTTGSVYRGAGVTHTSQNDNGPTDQLEFTTELHENLIGKGQSGNLRSRVTIHFTVNSNGTVTADVLDVSVECD